MLQEIFDLFRSREPIPFIILAMVCVGWIIVVERIILLQLTYRVNFSKFNLTLRKMLAAGDMERARSFCQATAKVGVPLIALRAIETYESDNFRVRMVVSEETLSFMPRIRRRIAQLPSLATMCVLLGALAAVDGVWHSFHMADVLELGLKNFAFTRGLSHSLTPLALSLMAAVLLMLPYGLLDAIAARLEGEVEHSLTIILNLLSPELQPVFGQPSMPTSGSHGGMPSGDGGHGGAGMNAGGGDGAVAAVKGPYEDVSNSDRSEPVPDEEEII